MDKSEIAHWCTCTPELQVTLMMMEGYLKCARCGKRVKEEEVER